MKQGDRVLRELPRQISIQEVEIMEISPDKKWVKYKQENGGFCYWIEKKDFKVVSELCPQT